MNEQVALKRLGMEISEKEYAPPGHTACAGCTGAAMLRQILKLLGPKVMMTNPASCSGYYARALEAPLCRSLFAAAASWGTGMRAALDMAGDKLEAYCGGSEPAGEINPQMVSAMAEKGIDMAFQTPQPIETALREGTPDLIVTMGCGEACPVIPGATHQDWDLPDPAGRSMDFMQEVRDNIEKRVAELVGTI